MNQKVSDDYYRNVQPLPKPSKKEFQQLLQLVETEADIQQLSQLKTLAHDLKEGKRSQILEQTTYGKQVRDDSSSVDAPSHLKNSVQSELSLLTNMINVLKAALGSNNPQVIELEQELAEAKKQLPNIDSALLTKILNQAINLEGQLSPTAQLAFLKAAQSFLQFVLNSSSTTISNLNQLINQINLQLSNLKAVQTDLANIEALLKLMNSGAKLTPDQLNQLLSSIQDLDSRYSSLNQSQQNVLNTILSELANASPSGQYPLAQILADYQMALWTKEYLDDPRNQPPTKEGLLNFLKQQMQNMPGSDENSFYYVMQQEMNGDLQNFPNSAQKGLPPWVNYNPTTGALSSSDAVQQYFIQNYAGPFNNVQTVLNLLSHLNQAIATQASNDQQQINGATQSIAALNQLSGAMNNALNKVQYMLIFAESLPDAFSDAILNHLL
jgi:acyl carrier protein phosphodiesterase